MDIEDASLAALIKQHQTSSSYSRAISMEFSRPHDSPTTKKQRSRVRTSQGEESNPDASKGSGTSPSTSHEEQIDNSDSDSYYSATEEPYSDDSPHDSAESSYDEGLNFVSANNDEQEKHVPYLCTKRSGSKKRSKWKRQTLNKEGLYPLMLGNTAIPHDISELHLTETRATKQTVASLAELCAHVYRGTQSLVPPGLQTSVRSQQSEHQHLNIVTAWLNKTLQEFDQELSQELPELRAQELKSREGKVRGGRKRECGTIWTRPHSTGWGITGWDIPDTLEGIMYEDSLATLPESEAVILGITTSPHPIAALAHEIDLLLPPFIKRTIGGSDRGDQTSCSISQIRVRNHLQKRYPRLVEWCFEEALAYAWWARGNVTQAEKLFLHLIDTAKNCEIKIVYLHELGRMYRDFEELGKASKVFLMAADVATSQLLADNHKQLAPLFELQGHLLAAFALETGVMIPERTQAAVMAWGRVLECECGSQFYKSVRSAINSLMCFHCSTSTAKCWTQNTILYLEKLKTKHPEAYLELSLWYAMQGEDKSADAYQMYINSFGYTHPDQFWAHLPGQQVFPINVRSAHDPQARNPWLPILNQVKATKEKIQPIRVLWRREFTHPTLQTDRVRSVGDLSVSVPRLWLDESGFIEADLSMDLPPCRQVQMDPYTGSLKYSPFTVAMATWRTHPCNEIVTSNNKPVGLHVPRISRLFEKDGVIVDILDTTIVVKYHGHLSETGRLVAIRQDRDGTRVTVNIKSKLQDCVRKMTEDAIATKSAEMPPESRMAFHKKMFNMVQHCYVQGLSLRYKDIKSAVQQKEENDTSEVKGAKKRDKKLKKEKKSAHPRFCVYLVDYLVFGGHSLVLIYNVRSLTVNSFIVVFDCSSPKTFQNVRVYCTGPDTKLDSPDYNTDSSVKRDIFAPYLESRVAPFADLFIVSEIRKSKERRIMVFNGAGDLSDVWTREHREQCIYRYVLGDTVIGLDLSVSRLVTRCPDEPKRLGPDWGGAVNTVCTLYCYVLVDVEGRGLTILDTDLVHIPLKATSSTCSDLSEDGFWLKGTSLSHLKVLCEEECETGEAGICNTGYRAVVAFGARVIVLEFSGPQRSDVVRCILDLPMAGVPNEACFISEKSGFLVCTSLNHSMDTEQYKDMMFHVSFEGHVWGILPNLGKGPHGFLPVYLAASDEVHTRHPSLPANSPGWYVYLRDGHGAIACVKLVNT